MNWRRTRKCERCGVVVRTFAGMFRWCDKCRPQAYSESQRASQRRMAKRKTLLAMIRREA